LEFRSDSTERYRGRRGAGSTNCTTVVGSAAATRGGWAGGGGGGSGNGGEQVDVDDDDDCPTADDAELCCMSTAATMAFIGLMPSAGDEVTAGSWFSLIVETPVD
jgi:hypothetical protein